MAYKIMLANTPDLIDQVFKLRHHVFAEKMGVFEPTPDGRIIDRFDAYPTTSTYVVVADNKVVGALRLALDSSEGVPADEFYDFRQYVPKDSYPMHAGFFCVDPEFRGARLAMGLMLMSTYFGISHGVTHVFAPINPEILRLVLKLGFEVLGEEFVDAHSGLPTTPLLLEADKLSDYFLDFVKKNQLHDFLLDYENWYFNAGEEIIKAGTTGSEAFIITEGTVEVRMAGTGQVLSELGQGEVVGELALLTNQPRSADVVAKTGVQAMVLSKEAFQKRFLQHPKQGLKLLEMMGKRTQSLLGQLEESLKGEDS